LPIFREKNAILSNLVIFFNRVLPVKVEREFQINLQLTEKFPLQFDFSSSLLL